MDALEMGELRARAEPADVVIHELCHRIHPDHSAAFHRLVARVLARAGLADEASLRRQLRGSDAAAWMR